MDMMNSIAATATSMRAEEFASAYSVRIAKSAMDFAEMAAEEVLDMLPETPPPTGFSIDVYA